MFQRLLDLYIDAYLGVLIPTPVCWLSLLLSGIRRAEEKENSYY